MWVLIIVYLTSTGVNTAHKEYDTLDKCITEQNYLVVKYNNYIKSATCMRLNQWK